MIAEPIPASFLEVIRQVDAEGITARDLVALMHGSHPDTPPRVTAVLLTAEWYRQAGCTRLTLEDFAATVAGRSPRVQEYVRQMLESIFAQG